MGHRYYDVALGAKGNCPARWLYFIGWSCISQRHASKRKRLDCQYLTWGRDQQWQETYLSAEKESRGVGASKPTRCELVQRKHQPVGCRPAPATVAPPPAQPDLGSGRSLGFSIGLPRAPAATGNTRNPANRNVQLRSCRPMAGRVRGWADWHWIPGYGAGGAGASCQVIAALVWRKVGEVRGHGGAPICSCARGWR